MVIRRISLAILVALVVAVVVGSCSGEDEADDWVRLMSLQVDQQVVIPTSKVRIDLGGTQRVVADSATVTLDGTVGEREVTESFELVTQRDGEVGPLHVVLDASAELWPSLQPASGEFFRGTLEVHLRDVLGVDARGTDDNISWRFVEELTPIIDFEPPHQIFSNSTVNVTGEGILRPEEGQTVAVIEQGQLEATRGHTVDLTGQELPVQWAGSREYGDLLFDPAVLGVHPGELEMTVRFENQYANGTTIAASGGDVFVDATVGTPFIASVSPTAASRGQLVELQGRGFVPPDAPGSYGMVLRFEGTLTPNDPELPSLTFEGATAAERTPYETVSDELLVQEIWYNVSGRSLEGLGAVPGIFDGRVTPVLYDSHGTVEGMPWEGQFEILPTRQMVYLKFLPAFSVATDRYGMANVEREIRQRILEVTNRDYHGLNIEFVDEPPQNFSRFATVEIGGPDPTGGQAFGFDNTYNDQPKDTGNLHIDDYLGGINPATGEEWNNPYGGVFVESFAQFSPTLYPEMGHASEHFDRVFGPFMPELGGQRVQATEWPEGPRTDEIAEAIRVFGNVVGNTVSHELGHALGLAYFEGDWESPGHIFHNMGDTDCIMDAGADRSFEQRAELDGEGPAQFNERNRAYLEQILPLPR